MKRTINKELTAALLAADDIALCSHVNPDGDTVGSVLAIRLGLLSLGKRVRVFCQDKIPDNLMFLEGASSFEKPEDLAADDHFSAVMAVDVSDSRRMGRCSVLLGRAFRHLLLDHHGTNPQDFAEICDVDGNAPACALLAYALLRDLGVKITVPIAECLYTGLSTDTGNFSFKSTSAEAFAVQAELMKTGFDMSELNRRLFRERAPEQLLLIRTALQSLELRCGGELAVMKLTLRDFGDCGALPEHADTVVNFGLDVRGVKMAVLGRESPDGKIKFSLRGVHPWAVDKIAFSLGGGGHDLAAGITIDGGTLDENTEKVAALMAKALGH